MLIYSSLFLPNHPHHSALHGPPLIRTPPTFTMEMLGVDCPLSSRIDENDVRWSPLHNTSLAEVEDTIGVCKTESMEIADC